MELHQPQQSNPSPKTVDAAPTNTMTAVALLITIAALLIAVTGVAYYIWYGMNNTPAAVGAAAPAPTVTAASATPTAATIEDDQKVQVFESLERNPDGLTTEEKRSILENLNRN